MKRVVIRPCEIAPEKIEGFGPGFMMKNPISPHTVGAQNLRVGYNIFPPRSGTAIHSHPGEEAWYVLRGQGFLRVFGRKYNFEAGCFMFVPAQVEHQVVNTGDESLEYIFVVSPPFDVSDNLIIEPFREKHLFD